MPTRQDYTALAWNGAVRAFGDTPLARVYFRMLSQESGNFDPDVVEGRRKSSAGATGIAQLMPVHFSAVDPLNPEAAVAYGATLVKNGLSRYGGDVAKAVASYNAGPGNVDRAINQGGANWRNFIPNETKLYLDIVRPEDTSNAVPTTPQRTTPATSSTAAASQQRLPVKGTITQGFGPTDEPLDGPYGGYAHFNKGLDFGVPVGTPVSAVTGGTVIMAGDNGDGWGTRVWVKAPDGTIHNYGHLSQAKVKVGDTVEPGQLIAASGNTGKSTGPHLSYDVWKVGEDGKAQYIDPTPYTRGEQGSSTGQVMTRATTMPTPKQSGVDPTLVKATRSRIDSLTQQQAKIQQIINDPKASLIDKSNATDALPGISSALNAAIDDYIKMTASGDNSIAQQNADTNRISALAGIDAQNQTNALRVQEQTQKFFQDLFGDNLQIQNLMATIYDNDRADARDAVKMAYDKGQLTLQQASNIVAAQDKQAMGELAWFAQGLAAAQFVSQERKWNALHQLPPDTHFAPMFAPSDALGSVMQRMGIPAPVIRVTPVDWEKMQPENAMATGFNSMRQQGVTKPNYDIQSIRNVDIAGLPDYQAQPYGTEGVGQSLTAALPNANASLGGYGAAQQGEYDDDIKALLEGDPLDQGLVVEYTKPETTSGPSPLSVVSNPNLGEGKATQGADKGPPQIEPTLWAQATAKPPPDPNAPQIEPTLWAQATAMPAAFGGVSVLSTLGLRRKQGK